MKPQKILFNLLLCSSILLLLGVEFVHCSSHHHHHHHHHHQGLKKLFVFGDSYADTGNGRNPDANSWRVPYGVTYPGKPSGRFSDGRIFTDFLAKSLGLKSPIPYIFGTLKAGQLKYGVNMAYGGTGVFDTKAPYPNMTTQIDIFQGLLDQGVFTPQDLKHAVAHVSLVGNDYSNYLANGGTVQGFQTFIPQVVNQLALNIQRIYNMGVKKISVTGLQPLGCLPRSTLPTQYQQCDSTFNQATQVHNLLVQQAVTKLNSETSNSATPPPFVLIDLYQTFSSIIQQPTGLAERNGLYGNLLKPCCQGINSTYSCGNVDANGNKMYTVCENPESTFFWDDSHPTQAGWKALTRSLQPTIQQLRY